MNSTLNFQLFKKEDYPEYYSWFQDTELNKQLGPMEEKDDEWLTYVIHEQAGLSEYKGCTYSIFLNDKLVAVLGIAYPHEVNPCYGISSIAVKPQLRQKGIGKKILKALVKLYPLKKGQYWIAYVDEQNPKAKLFFEKNGWNCGSKPNENNMFLFEYRS